MNTAVVAIAKNEDKYIDEWAQYHLKLGFDQIVIFENNWRYKGDLGMPNANGEVKLLHYPFDGAVMQLPAYNSFIKYFSNAYDWAAFIDVDEFIVNNTRLDFKTALDAYRRFTQIGLNWRLMGDSGMHYDGTENSVLKRFTHGSKTLNKHVKQLVNFKLFRELSLQMPLFINPHCTDHMSCTPTGQNFSGPFNERGLDEVMPFELYHYAVKTREELHEKVMRGRADSVHDRRNEEEQYFKDHNINEVTLTAAKDFFEM